jgi:hypothetical protein
VARDLRRTVGGAARAGARPRLPVNRLAFLAGAGPLSTTLLTRPRAIAAKETCRTS